MILFLLLLIAACGIVAVFAMSGNGGAHDVTLWQWHWSAVPDWVPVVLTAAVFGGLLLLYMLYSGLVHGVRVGSMRRRVTTRESAITELRRENQRLREENARVRSELGTTTTDREPVAATDAPDRPRPAAPYRPRATFGERLRAFFNGGEPAGY
jgi:uncharacterized integral membrane protein